MARRFRMLPHAALIVVLAALVALAVAPAAGAAPPTGFAVALGEVVDTAGAPLGGATLTFTPLTTLEVGHPPAPIYEHPPAPIRVTNPGGQFQILLLAGTYRVTAEFDGHTQVQNTNIDSIIVQEGVVARYTFVMRADSTP